MFTLLAPFLGILGSLLPSLIDIFKRSQEVKYEIALTKLQLDVAMQNAQINLDVEEAKADVADAESVRSYDNNVDGGPRINALKASIRPVITYSFFALFVLIKLTQLAIALNTGAGAEAAMIAVWDQDTVALFGTIIGFWFGNRSLAKMGYGGMTKPSITILPSTTKIGKTG